MRYKLSGKISVREQYGPGDILKDHTEIVEADSEEEAIDLSLSGFEEWEEPCWERGYPKIKKLNQGTRV